jgi:hypothetical protein
MLVHCSFQEASFFKKLFRSQGVVPTGGAFATATFFASAGSFCFPFLLF